MQAGLIVRFIVTSALSLMRGLFYGNLNHKLKNKAYETE